MRLFPLLTLALCLVVTIPLSPPALTQQAELAPPTGEDFPEAGANCKRKLRLSTAVTTPTTKFTETIQCVLLVHTCDGPKEYRSNVRKDRRGACDDYWKAARDLQNREVCCDPKCDEQTVCEAVDRALDAIREARTAVGAASLRYKKLQEDLGPLLDRIRNELCDNFGAQNVVDEVKRLLDELKNTVGLTNEERVSRLEEMRRGLSQIKSSLCGDDQSQPELPKCETPKESGPRFRVATDKNKFYPFEASPEDLLPLQACPGCLWELTAVDFSATTIGGPGDRLGRDPTPSWSCFYRYIAIWRCPSNGIVKLTRTSQQLKERCKLFG